MYRNHSLGRPVLRQQSGGGNGSTSGKIDVRLTGTRIDDWVREREMDRAGPASPGRRLIRKVNRAINISQPPVTVKEVLLSGDRASGDFIKGISHELHTPLHVIIGLCQLLERDGTASLSPLQRDAVERMERNARALLETANRLLGCLRSGQFE